MHCLDGLYAGDHRQLHQPEPGSWPASFPVHLEVWPVKSPFQTPGPATHPFQCCARLGITGADRTGDQAGHWLAVACNDDLFAVLDAVQKHREVVFRFQSSNNHRSPPFFSAYAGHATQSDCPPVIPPASEKHSAPGPAPRAGPGAPTHQTFTGTSKPFRYWRVNIFIASLSSFTSPVAGSTFNVRPNR